MQFRTWLETYYHGTQADFDKLKLNKDGILWLSPTKEASSSYTEKYWHKSEDKFIWEVEISQDSIIINLNDLSNPIIKNIKNQVSDARKFTYGEIADADWHKFADFGLLEGYPWI